LGEEDGMWGQWTAHKSTQLQSKGAVQSGTESQTRNTSQAQGNPGRLPGGRVFELSLVKETGIIKEAFR